MKYGKYCKPTSADFEKLENFPDMLLMLQESATVDASLDGIVILPGPPERKQNPSGSIAVFCWPAINYNNF